MHFSKALPLLLTLVHLQLGAGLDLPTKSRFSSDGDEHIRKLFQSELDPIKRELETERKALNKLQHELEASHQASHTSPRFQQTNAGNGDMNTGDIVKSLHALTSILKPGAVDALNHVASIASEAGNQMSPNTPSLSPERLTSLITSALTSQPPGFGYDRINKLLENWKSQLAQPQFANLLHLSPPSPNGAQNPQIPVAAQSPAPPPPAVPSFMQVAQPQYIQLPPTFAQMPQPFMMPMPFMQMAMPSPFAPPQASMMPAQTQMPTQISASPVEFSNINDFKAA